MAVDIIWYVVAPVTLVTLLYQWIPYRDLPVKKPLSRFSPKISNHHPLGTRTTIAAPSG